jgi:hypothetical protein
MYYDTDALRALSRDLVAHVVTLYRQARDQFAERLGDVIAVLNVALQPSY